MFVYVIDKNNMPLNPISPKKAKHLLNKGIVKVHRKMPFTVKHFHEQVPTVNSYTLGIKFNKDEMVSVVVNSKNQVVYQSKIDIGHSNLIKNKMKKRANYRRTRRSRKTRYRKPRFDNRTKKNTITPTVQSKLNNILKEVRFLRKILQITNIIIEGNKFDKNKLDGDDSDWEDIRKAVYTRDKYKCKFCNGKSGDFRLEAHHIISKVDGGKDDFDNLITLCKDCHVKVHKGEIDLKGKRFSKSFNVFESTQRLQVLKLIKEIIPDVVFEFGSIVSKKRLNENREYSLLGNVLLLVGGSKKLNEVFCKKFVSRGDYQQRKGVRSQIKIPTRKLFGFRKFDKVRHNGKEYFVKGKRSSGYFSLTDVGFKNIGLNSVSVELLERVSSRNGICIVLNSSND
jgi:hypothetical protein